MLSLIATVLVLAFLVFMVWPWFWHIMTTLALVLLVYLAWPWLQQPWEDLTSSWLQQARAHVPQFSPQRTDESRNHFEEHGQEEYPRPYPQPILVDRWRGHDVFWWKGECWFLRHDEEPYRFLCVVHGRLQWCWRNEVSYRNDS
jgi:hypothetical protein